MGRKRVKQKHQGNRQEEPLASEQGRREEGGEQSKEGGGQREEEGGRREESRGRRKEGGGGPGRRECAGGQRAPEPSPQGPSCVSISRSGCSLRVSFQ